MLSARWDLLNNVTGRLTVKAESRKGKRRDKSWRLSRETLALLDEIREPTRELIFPWPHNHATIYNRYRRLLKRAGLPHDRYRLFHCIRKSSASHLLAAGGNPTEHLGHADAATTRVYMVPSIVETASASDLLFRPNPGRALLLLTAEGSVQ
jgi:integrase